MRGVRRGLGREDHARGTWPWNLRAAPHPDHLAANFARLEPWVWSAHIHDLYEDYPYHEFIGLLKAAGFTGFCLIEMPESCEPERLLKYYSRLWAEWTR